MPSGSEVRSTDQLHELTPMQAQEVLAAFLKAEAKAFSTLEINSIILDYSQRSVVSALQYVAELVETGRLSEEERIIWFARLGYYFGEALRQSNSCLNWTVGDPRYAFANHPVLRGFADDEEAPVIMICKNMIMSVAEHYSPVSRIENGVRNWFEKKAVK